MSNAKSVLFFCILLFSFNISTYIFASLLDWSVFINALILIFAALSIKNKVIILLPLFIYSPISQHTNIPFFSLVCVISLFWYFLKFRTIFLPKEVMSYGFFLLFILLSILYCEQYDYALGYISPYLQALAILALFPFLKRDPATSAQVLVCLAMASALLIFYKLLYIVNVDVINKHAGFTVEELKGKVDVYYDYGFVRRLVIVGQDPNYAGAIQLIGLVVSIWLAKLRFSYTYLPVIGLLGAASNYFQMLGSYSRSSFIVGSFILLTLVRINIRSILLMVGGVFAIVGYILSNPSLLARVISIKDNTTASNRTQLWGNAVDIWSENPIFGEGFTDYLYYVGDAAHSTFFQILAEQGIMGLIAFIVFVFSCSRILKFQLLGKDWNILVGFIGFLIMLQSITFFQMHFLVFLLFVFQMILVFSKSDLCVCGPRYE